MYLSLYICHLYIRSYYLHEGESPHHQYDYELCKEVELFATADGKPVPFFLDLKGKNSSNKPKEVLTVAKGQKVVINVNQEVSLDNIVAGKDDFDIGTDGQTFSLTADKNMEIAITVSNYCSPRFKKTFYVRFQDKPLEEPSPKEMEFFQLLSNYMDEYGITSSYDRAALLASIQIETGKYGIEDGLIEIGNFSLENWLKNFPNNKGVLNWLDKHKKNREVEFENLENEDKLNIMYGGRLGNKKPGDGWKFRGRGGIHLTGHNNYEEFAKFINRPDIMDNPDKVGTDLRLAALASVWFWTKYDNGQASKLARKGNFRGARKIVNKYDHTEELANEITRKNLAGKGKFMLPVPRF